MTAEDAFTIPASGRTPVVDEPIDVGDLIRSLVLAADYYRASAAQAMGVHVVELTAIGHISHAGQLTPRDLATKLRMTTPAITALLDRLEQRDMVRRRPNPADRRSLLLTLTPSAVAGYSSALSEMSEVTTAALHGLTEAEIGAVRHALRYVALAFLDRSNGTARRVA